MSTAPTIIDASGNSTGATLRVLKPDSISNEEVVTYLIQAFSDATATTAVGQAVTGVNTVPANNGSSLASPYIFLYPYLKAAQLWFKVTVVVGKDSSASSLISTPVVVGEPLAAGNQSWLGGCRPLPLMSCMLFLLVAHQTGQSFQSISSCCPTQLCTCMPVSHHPCRHS